jgi:hypothetical protein
MLRVQPDFNDLDVRKAVKVADFGSFEDPFRHPLVIF